MATFQVTDAFGLDETLTPGDGALSKYFQDLPDIGINTIDLFQIKDQDLTNPAVTDFKAGLNFSKQIDIGHPMVELTVAPTSSAELAVFVPSAGSTLLFDPDTFGDNIQVPTEQRYVSLALSAQLEVGASVSPGDLKFGFDAKSGVTMTYYQRFAAGTTVVSAVKTVIEGFRIPADLDDIAKMPEGSIATVDSTGDLKFSGSVTLPASPNPLATSNDIPVLGALAVNGGGSITVGADYEFAGDYQFRVQKLQGGRFRLGVYKKRDSTFDFTVDVDASLTAKLGDNDLIVSLMQAISKDPETDLKTLKSADLTDDESKAIQTAVKNAVNRSLEIGASLEFSREAESDAMFLYEVDPNAIQADGSALLHAALEGDFSGLVKTDVHPPAGITLLKTILSTTKTSQYSLKLNLLGIFNASFVSTLMVTGKSAWDAETGQLVLTDSASADNVDVLTSNLQVKNPDKLRLLLAQHFMITVAYLVVNNTVGVPELTGSQTYFLMESNPSRVRMRDYLFLSVALGLQGTPTALAQLPGNVDDFGQTTVYAEASYDTAACRSLFFHNGQLIDQSVYDLAGLEAIKSLVQPGDPDDYRLKLATNYNLLQQLKGIGNVQSGDFATACVNAGIARDKVSFIGTDYLDIVWLADALHQAGTKLKAIDDFLQQNPHTDPNNHDFLNKKRALANSLKSVVGNATANFGGPWGFEAMAWIGKSSSKKWLVLNQHVVSTLPAAQ